MNLLVTGGCGFIGSHLLKLLLSKYPNYNIINLDKINYAVNKNLIEEFKQYERHTLIEGDIFDKNLVDTVFNQYNIDAVIHVAAESAVDRSIKYPIEFLNSNVVGTVNLLEAFRSYVNYKDNPSSRFYYISTDEVYGSLEAIDESVFTEISKINPRNPYSASKAGGESFVQAYSNTYDLPILISRCANNYGPYQYKEKLIPKTILNAYNNNDITVYDTGESIREWLFVQDHVEAMDLIFHKAPINSIYNVGSREELSVINAVNKICDLVDSKLGRSIGTSRKLIKHIMNARPGNDFRYSLCVDKINKELNWKATISFDKGIESTVSWYLEKHLYYL